MIEQNVIVVNNPDCLTLFEKASTIGRSVLSIIRGVMPNEMSRHITNEANALVSEDVAMQIFIVARCGALLKVFFAK